MKNSKLWIVLAICGLLISSLSTSAQTFEELIQQYKEDAGLMDHEIVITRADYKKIIPEILEDAMMLSVNPNAPDNSVQKMEQEKRDKMTAEYVEGLGLIRLPGYQEFTGDQLTDAENYMTALKNLALGDPFYEAFYTMEQDFMQFLAKIDFELTGSASTDATNIDAAFTGYNIWIEWTEIRDNAKVKGENVDEWDAMIEDLLDSL